jgi:hypothetical protein
MMLVKAYLGMYLSDSKASEAMYSRHRCLLSCQPAIVSPPPVAFCLLFLSCLSFEPFGRPRFRGRVVAAVPAAITATVVAAIALAVVVTVVAAVAVAR